MHVRKRIFTFLFAALAMLLCTACGKWDYSREAMKAANDAQGQTLRVEFKVNQTFTNALRAAAEDNIQPADVDNAMTMDKSIEKLLTSGYRLDVYALRADIDADKAAAQLADEFVSRLAGCEDEGYISMVKAENGYFYEAVLVYKHDSGSSGGGAGDDDGASGGDEDDGFTGRWVDWNATTQTLKILPRASEKIGDTLTEDEVMEALKAQGEPTEGFSFSSVKVLDIDEKSGVTKIGDSAFNNDNSAPSPRNLTTANLGSVQEVGMMAFCYCSELTSVEMPNVTTVGDNAFMQCTGLVLSNEDISTVTSMGFYAFGYCTSLNITDLSNVTSLGSGAFCATNLTEVTLNDQITSIDAPFIACSSLHTIHMPRVTILGKRSFWQCKALTTVDAPNLKHVGEEAFEACSSLAEESFDFSKLETIGDTAFSECTGLTRIDLQNVKTIGENAFAKCSKLSEIRLGTTLASVGEDAFDQVGSPLTIYYGDNQNPTENDFLEAIEVEDAKDIGKDDGDTWNFKPESSFTSSTRLAINSIPNPAARFILNL